MIMRLPLVLLLLLALTGALHAWRSQNGCRVLDSADLSDLHAGTLADLLERLPGLEIAR